VKKVIEGKAYVLGDDIDTDQIIPAEYLVFNPAIPEERARFGEYALSGVPPAQAGLPQGNVPFVAPGAAKSEYKVIIGGSNFGCGSSREHAPLALAEAGIEVVVARFYARIFFRNSVNGGYLIPYETPVSLTGKVSTGDTVRIDLNTDTLTNLSTGETFALTPLGDILPILEAGDVFEYAKKSGMMAAA
jgi:3-isopropylmalate/(R)-2-methylmalate dehydratase small subunit